MKNWDALANEWKAIVRTHRDDEDRLQSQVERLAERWDSSADDTGGGFMVAEVPLDRDHFALVSADACVLYRYAEADPVKTISVEQVKA